MVPIRSVCLEVDGVERECTNECTDTQSCPLNEVVGSVTYAEVRDSKIVLQVYDSDVDSNDSGGLVNVLMPDLEDRGIDVTSPLDYGFQNLVVRIVAD